MSDEEYKAICKEIEITIKRRLGIPMKYFVNTKKLSRDIFQSIEGWLGP